jgi:chromosome segregation ATPase
MARAHFVKKARKDYPDDGIKKGDSYYWWKFNFSPFTHRQLTSPKRSQLTQSSFLSELYDIQDDISKAEFTDGVEDELQEFIDRIDELKDQAQESLDNMPEHLQESSQAGETLTERIDALEGWSSDLSSIDTEIDKEQISEEIGEDGDLVSDYDKEDVYEEQLQERIDKITAEIQNCECSL